MAPVSSQHRRTHNLLLIAKLLGQRDTASPFTLVLDSLEQSAKPLVAEVIKRANAAKSSVIFVSFENVTRPKNVEHFVPAWKNSVPVWQKEISEYLKLQPTQRKLIIFDSLNPVAASAGSSLAALLSGFITPTVSLLAVYHLDVPIAELSGASTRSYSPHPLNLLKYIATSVMTTHSLHHVLARKAARDRSHAEPSFGLEAGAEGVLQDLGANGASGVVIELEHRRKSGRGIRESYVLQVGSTADASSRESIILLEDHPLYSATSSGGDATHDEEPASSTFELGLTQKQREDRQGVVLPYFDAQKGGGEGGRILYDMGEDDDFDEEEDEI